MIEKRLSIRSDKSLYKNFIIKLPDTYLNNVLMIYYILTCINDEGPNCCMNASTVNLYLHNWPQAVPLKTLVHLSQSK